MFTSIYSSSVTAQEFFSMAAAAVLCGTLYAWIMARRVRSTKRFFIVVSMIPFVVGAVIPFVNGNIGTGVAIGGAFSLIRFRSAQGSADEAVAAYLRGELINTGANCDHHHGEEHACGSQGCGEHGCHSEGGCGGCHGGIQGKNVGKTCRVHYRGTFNDGAQFDSSYDRGEPLEFVCGAGQMIPGFDAAVADMEPGEHRDVHLTPEEAYGEADPEAVVTLEIASLPGAEAVSVGERVYLQDPYGQPIPVRITAKDEKTVTFDANHEMAGRELNFHIELVEVN